MKTFTITRSLVHSVLIATFALPLLLVAAPESGKPAYTLFMGADLLLEHGDTFHRVEDVSGSRFKITLEGKEVFVMTEFGTARMRIDNGLKLAGTPVALGDLKAERAYTPARDPNRKFNRMAASSAGASAAVDVSNFQANMAQQNLGGVMGNPYSTADQVAIAQSGLDAANRAQENAQLSIGSDLNSAASHAHTLALELAEENFDAIELKMQVSSPVPLDNPYVLIIARIHERDEKPGVFRSWIFAKKLDPIGTRPEKIYINQGGLPIGYSLEDYQVRIYNHGREMPTSHSPKRVDLTRDEALQFIVIEHLAANKDASVPAAPVFGEAPADLKTRVAAGDFTQPYYVKVDATGHSLGTFTDKECKRAAADPYVESVVSSVLFAPALEKGEPVEGVARVELAALLN
ncbi:MAG TPA: hypothetical protein VMM36_13590 [Opitutaceae bacterium]|nr:hypothetical protein [Opitutaceae bacterium]